MRTTGSNRLQKASRCLSSTDAVSFGSFAKSLEIHSHFIPCDGLRWTRRPAGHARRPSYPNTEKVSLIGDGRPKFGRATEVEVFSRSGKRAEIAGKNRLAAGL